MRTIINKISNGLYLLLAGFVFLWIMLGFTSWNIIFQFLRLWPLFFIIVGIDAIFGRTKLFYLRMISPILVIGAIFGIIYVSQDGSLFHPREIELYKANKEVVSVNKTTDFNFDISSGKLILTDGNDDLISANLNTATGNKPKVEFKEFKGEDSYEISETLSNDYVFVPWDSRHLWDIEINKKAPVKIKAKTNTSINKFQMSELSISSFVLDTKFSSNEIILNENIEKVRISSLGSKLSIVIPKGVGVRIFLDKFLITDNFEEIGLNRNFKEYISPNYNDVVKRIDLDLSLKLTQLEIKFN
ncbi:MAG: toast rack family protein [Patescibacteria group bacterium]|nr:toast rack family protein [Patescibacteria group bacterium]